MTPIIKKLSRLFGKSGEEAEKAELNPDPEKKEVVTESQASVAPETEAQETVSEESNFSKPPAVRRVIQAPDLVAETESAPDADKIIIKAAPSGMGDQCKLMVNRPLFSGHSWYFPSFESASGSPLAESIFSCEGVETLLIHDSTAVVTKTGSRTMKDWETLARELGSQIRSALENSGSLLSEDILKNIPGEGQVREEIQKVIDTEVNPGVAGHGGRITLTKVEGNTVTIEMGGGCQGCSSADLTLKQGIHNAFRKAVPYVGAIYDETDHAAGVNPYFS